MHDETLREYKELLSIPSISSEPQYKKDVSKCADWVVDYLKKMHFQVSVWPTSGHPTIFAEYKVDPKLPTLLLYNHYDVQPVDPLELWDTPPFEPTVKDGEIYARGAQDNKGQLFYTLQALKNRPPINIKWIIEGEEECGSVGLEGILDEHREALKSDYMVIVDVGIPDPTTPAVTLGVRGLVTLEVQVEGTSTDLHSGSHGGIAFNPIHALVQLLAKLRDENGKITIPGYYDDIVTHDNSMLSTEFDEKKYEATFGAKPTGGEKGYSPLQRNWFRPSIEINGIHGGYTGDGFKTVIPAKAFAKISCRLVAGQCPEKSSQMVADFLTKNAPDGIKVSVTRHSGGGPAVRSAADSKLVKAFADAYATVFNKPCKYILDGASIPVVSKLAQVSGAEVLLVGLGLATDKIHAPNEHFGLDRIQKGTQIITQALQNLKEAQ